VTKIGNATKAWQTKGIETLQKAEQLDANNKGAMEKDIDAKIDSLNSEIRSLTSHLPPDHGPHLPVIKEDGSTVDSDDLKKDPSECLLQYIML
jgi:hypothetical protein